MVTFGSWEVQQIPQMLILLKFMSTSQREKDCGEKVILCQLITGKASKNISHEKGFLCLIIKFDYRDTSIESHCTVRLNSTHVFMAGGYVDAYRPCDPLKNTG